MARNNLSMPPDFVALMFSFQRLGAWSQADKLGALAAVANLPADAPARMPGDVFVRFEVQMPDAVRFSTNVWITATRQHEGDSAKVKDALLRFTYRAPEVLKLTRDLVATQPESPLHFTKDVKAFLSGHLEKVDSTCFACGASKDTVVLRKCARCSCARYCDESCQRADWKRHRKTECADLVTLLLWHHLV